jgi:Ca2+/Na+ antiporter
MDQLPDPRMPPDTGQRLTRLIHVSMEPKTRLGKLLFAIFGVSLVILAFFVSILVFVLVATIALVFALYVMWVVNRVRRSVAEDLQTRHREETAWRREAALTDKAATGVSVKKGDGQ